MRLKEWWQDAILALDWYGRLTLIISLGVGAVLVSLGTGALGLVAPFRWWVLVLLGLSLALVCIPLALLLGTEAGCRVQRRREARQPKLTFDTTEQAGLAVYPSMAIADFVLIRVSSDIERSRRNAESVRLRLSFWDATGKLIGRIPGRPANSADYPTDGNENPITIPSGEHREFNVAVRFRDDAVAYMINSEGFNAGSKKQGWELPPGIYTVEARFFHANGSELRLFRLDNPVDGPLRLEVAGRQ
jgi:hypothetical protein